MSVCEEPQRNRLRGQGTSSRHQQANASSSGRRGFSSSKNLQDPSSRASAGTGGVYMRDPDSNKLAPFGFRAQNVQAERDLKRQENRKNRRENDKDRGENRAVTPAQGNNDHMLTLNGKKSGVGILCRHVNIITHSLYYTVSEIVYIIFYYTIFSFCNMCTICLMVTYIILS